MAFANLFTTLRAVSEDARGSESAFPPSSTLNEDVRENGQGRRGRKRTKRGGRNESHKKSRFCQAQTSSTNDAHGSFQDDYSKFTDDHMVQTGVDHAGFTVGRDLVHSQSREAGQENTCHRVQNYKTNVKKQQQQKKKMEEEENHHWQKNRREPANRRGWRQNKPTSWKGARGNRKEEGKKQDFQVERKRFMTQEFMEQNALLVDGRVLCRHFLWGRCIKGDGCQLEHIQGFNNLIKEVCKFYVQGFCSKEESCPYMHNSFPCKFFHAKGRCTQGADCRFSHEPLTELTKQLLDEAMTRDRELFKLTSKAEHDASVQPANTDESVNIEASATPDTLTLPIRPNLYNSTGPHAEEENLDPTEGTADSTEDETDAAMSRNPTANLTRVEPVCYSVEAILGPQISKPFPSFHTHPKTEEPTTLSDPHTATDHTSVPYSVEAVLRPHKEVGNSSRSHSSTCSTAQTVSYDPRTVFDSVTCPPLRSANQNDEVSYLSNTANESNTSQENSFKSLSNPQIRCSQPSTLNSSTRSCPDLPLTSRVHKEQGRDTPESQKPARRGKFGLCSPVSELENTKTGLKVGSCSKTYSLQVSAETQKHRGVVFSIEKCQNDAVHPCKPINSSQRAFHSLFSRPPGQTFTPQYPAQMKPHLSCPSSGSQKPVHSHHSSSLVSVGRTEIQHPQSGPKAGPQQHDDTETTADSGDETAHCVESSDGWRETIQRPFHKLFARPITDILQPIQDSATESCPQSFIQSSSLPTLRPTECRSKDVPDVELGKPTSRSFLSLFAAPLSEIAAPLPHKQSKAESERTSCHPQVSVGPRSSASTQRDSNFPGLDHANLKQISHAPVSPDEPKAEKEENSNSAERKMKTSEQVVNTACSPMSDSVNETSHNHIHSVDRLQPLPNDSSGKGSVLKTLFLSLSPYRADTEQQGRVQSSFPSEREKDSKKRTGCIFPEQLRTVLSPPTPPLRDRVGRAPSRVRP